MRRNKEGAVSKSDSPTSRQPARRAFPAIEAVPSHTAHETPFRLSAPVPMGRCRATLTVLTGSEAGRLVAVGRHGSVIGRARDADLIVDDDAVSRYHARISPAEDGGFAIEDLGSINGTFVGANHVVRSSLVTGDQVQLGREFRLRFRIIDAGEETLYRSLYESSVHDGLTRAFNRRHFSDRLFVEVSHARRANIDLAALMIDVDRLKELNDTYGHLVGDRALCGVVAVIAGSIRSEDLLARYGGDELAVLAPRTDPRQAYRLAARSRCAVEGLRLVAGGKEVPVSVSIGVASLSELGPSSEPHVALLSLADERLYQAKRSGRNSVFPGSSGRTE
jgi:two-component system, cell cycle response regulator